MALASALLVRVLAPNSVSPVTVSIKSMASGICLNPYKLIMT